MSMEASDQVVVKNDPSTLRLNKEQSIKQESQPIPISDSKRTRQDISIDYPPNKRKRQSMKVKEEPIDQVEVKDEEKLSATEEFSTTSIAYLNEETNDGNQLKSK